MAYYLRSFSEANGIRYLDLLPAIRSAARKGVPCTTRWTIISTPKGTAMRRSDRRETGGGQIDRIRLVVGASGCGVAPPPIHRPLLHGCLFTALIRYFDLPVLDLFMALKTVNLHPVFLWISALSPYFGPVGVAMVATFRDIAVPHHFPMAVRTYSPAAVFARGKSFPLKTYSSLEPDDRRDNG
jgi:hypothetical protein